MQFRIDFDFLNECLEEVKTLYMNIKEFENTTKTILSDIKSLFVIVVIGQDDFHL